MNDANLVKNPLLAKEWKLNYRHCFVCGCDCLRDWIGPQVHHIIKRGRSDEVCNFLYVCERCHRVIEGEKVRRTLGGYWPGLELCHVLWYKKARTPKEYDRRRLGEIYKRYLPAAKKPDTRWLEEYRTSPAHKQAAFNCEVEEDD